VSDVSALSTRYAAALQSYLAGSDEQALEEAYGVGREALEAGLGPLVLFSIHRDVVDKLAPQPIDPNEFVRQVTTVFIETLGPYQMTYASFDEARTAVEDLSAMLTDHVAVVERVRNRLDGMGESVDARRRLIGDIVTAQEEERRRIGGEIHDDAVQAMTVVMLRLGLLARRMTDPEDLAAIRELESSVGAAIASLRHLIAGLIPPELDRAGLAVAVRSLLERLEAEFELAHGLEAEPSPEVGAITFRIVQEALVNVRKHSRATRIKVLLESRDGGVLARVDDNGTGFDVDATLERVRAGHLGLAAMRQRAELVGGWLKIRSGTSGTSVEFWIPDVNGKAA
jgi:signal transduction histidine kinase